MLVLIRYKITGMKWKIGILLAMLAAMAPMANAVIVSVEVGDRPYYVHGPGYYVGRVYWVWIPGHWRWHHHHGPRPLRAPLREHPFFDLGPPFE